MAGIEADVSCWRLLWMKLNREEKMRFVGVGCGDMCFVVSGICVNDKIRSSGGVARRSRMELGWSRI